MQMATQDEFVASLRASPLFWDGLSQTVPLTAGEAGTVVYDVDDTARDGYGYPVVSYDVLVSSGMRPDGLPRDDPARGSGGPYFGPPLIYTCYRVAVTFADDTIQGWQRSSDLLPELLECPQPLVDALGGGAQYQEPGEFDG